MKKLDGRTCLLAAAAAALLFVVPASANNFNNFGNFHAVLSGGQEVPAVSTSARGKAVLELRPSVDVAGTSGVIRYQAGWEHLEGEVLQAHLHFGAHGTNGGVIAFLCSNLDSTPQGVPTCPQRGAVSGLIRADQILGPDGQGIAPGELGEVARALRSGLVYVNVHTSLFPGGEIRGQVRRPFSVGVGPQDLNDVFSDGFSQLDSR